MQIKKDLVQYDGDFFVLRTPLLPVKYLLSLQEKMKLEENELEVLNTEFKKIFRSKILKEAIYLASPILYYELIKFLNIGSYRSDRLMISLYQYYCRMCTRCTPFGLFAGFSFGKITQKQTNLKMNLKTGVERYCRIDTDFLCNMVDSIIDRYDNNLFFYNTNSTIYPIASKLRYIETNYQNKYKKYNITHVDKTALLEAVLKFCERDRHYDAIVDYLSDFNIPQEKAKKYVEDLIQSQLLVNNLNANVTGDDYMITLHKKLLNIPKLSKEAKLLESTIIQLRTINNDNAFSVYRKIKKSLSKDYTTLDESKLFQVDLIKKVSTLNLNEKILDDIKQAVNVLMKFGFGNDGNKKLTAFKKAFQDKYEKAWVKFTDVLDAEIGINYDDLIDSRNSTMNNMLNDYRLNKYIDCIRNFREEIEITDVETEKFRRSATLPDSVAVMARINLNDDGSHQIEFRNSSGPSAANLLGRFCPADPHLNKAVKKILRKEEKVNPGKIYAEIAHIPQARLGNILTRPHLRNHEIQFLSQSDVKPKNKISIQDLYLKLDLGRFILYSKKHKKEIIPRLSTAHNYSSGNLQIYHFLCDLQSQDNQRAVYWDWGSLSQTEFLPRVVYKNIILSPAIWNLSIDALLFFKNEKSTRNWELFTELKSRLKIPDKVMLVENDNELLVDLTLRVSLELLKKNFIKHNKVLLKEVSFSNQNLIIRDENDHGYTNEIIVPLTRVETKSSNYKEVDVELFDDIRRKFDIGSEWVYFKIYTGISTSDHILRDIIPAIIEKLNSSMIIDNWFFIRYADPDSHLRVRFHLLENENFGELVQTVTNSIQELLESGEISAYKLDTYTREIERYGRRTIKLSEDLFCINSSTITKILKIYHTSRSFSPDEKLFISLKAIQGYLNSFELSDIDKLEFLAVNRNLFADEFNYKNSKSLKDQVQNFYRHNRLFMEELIQRDLYSHAGDKYDDVCDILKIEYEHTLIVAKQIIEKVGSREELYSLLSSYIHMYMNRLIPANNRFNEFLMYEYLERNYKSILARNKQKNNTKIQKD